MKRARCRRNATTFLDSPIKNEITNLNIEISKNVNKRAKKRKS